MAKTSFHTIFSLILVFFLLASIVSAQSTCSASSPCPEGCCSKFGNCGYGPDFCAPANCTSSCTAKSQCDPGGWGSTYAQSEVCPLKVCCSQYGFCGTTSEFCGTKTVPEPSCSGSSATGRTIGYYEGWAVTRNCDNMYPEQIDVAAFTHLNFAFALIDPNTFAVAPMSSNDPSLYQRITNLKTANAGLKVWISIGGWSMNDTDQPTATSFSKLAASTSAQSAFFTSLLSLMATYGFDGVDLDWEYPVAPERSGNAADYANYVSFLKNLKAALTASGHHYGLSITIPASYWYLQNFDIVNIEPIVDWFNMMTYDLHGTWDSTDVWIGAIAQAHTNLTEIDLAMQLLWRNGITPGNVNLGLGFYGRSFTLANPSCTAAGCPFSSGGNPGPCTATSGVLSYSEINDLIAAGGVTVTTDTVAAVEIATFGGNQWVSYDSVATFQQKVNWANSHCLGGTFVWAVSLDDTNGTAAGALSVSTNQIALSEKSVSIGSSSDYPGCIITDCAKTPVCPIGKSAVQQTNGNVQNAVVPGCPKGQTSTYCCPSNDLPTCHWIGSARLCISDKCATDEIQLATDTSNCWFNHKTLCCSKSLYQIEQGTCAWEGGCTLGSKCSDGSTPLYTSQYLGGSHCWLGVNKYCCAQPPRYTNCYTSTGFFAPIVCNGACSNDKITVFTDPGKCLFGSVAFCCDMVIAPDDPTVAAFTEAMNAFKAAPTCSVSDTREPYSSSNLNENNFRRDLAARDPELSKLFEARSLKDAGGSAFVDLLVLAMLGQSQYSQIFQTVWEQILGTVYNFHRSDWLTLWGLFPEYDPVGLADIFLCNLQNAQAALTRALSTRTMCEDFTLGSVTKKRDIDNQSFENLTPEDLFPKDGVARIPKKGNEKVYEDLKKRIFGQDAGNTGTGGGGNAFPFTGALMQAVINNNVPLLYIRQLTYQGSANELNLEVVFDLTNAPALQQTAGEDIFAVFHFHARGLTANGNPQIEYFHAFHGQYVIQRYGAWHVDGRDQGEFQQNQRTPIQDCPYLPNGQRQVWIPGPAGNPPGSDAASQMIYNFGMALYNRGILTDASFFFTPTQAAGRALMTWNYGTGTWNFNSLRESENFGPNRGPSPADMSPTGGGWPQPPTS